MTRVRHSFSIGVLEFIPDLVAPPVSDWKEIPMKKGKDGYFRTQVELDDGIYHYKFRVQTKSSNFEIEGQFELERSDGQIWLSCLGMIEMPPLRSSTAYLI